MRPGRSGWTRVTLRGAAGTRRGVEKAQGGTSGGQRCRGQGTVRRGGGDGLEGTRGDQGPPGAWAGGWVWGRVVSGHQRAERGDRRLRARETGRLGESSAGGQAAGSPTWMLCVQRGSGSSGRGDGDGELAAAIHRERGRGAASRVPWELPAGLQTPPEAAAIGASGSSSPAQGSLQEGTFPPDSPVSGPVQRVAGSWRPR